MVVFVALFAVVVGVVPPYVNSINNIDELKYNNNILT